MRSAIQLFIVLAAVTTLSIAVAQEQEKKPEPAPDPGTKQPEPAAEQPKPQPTAEEVLNELLRRKAEDAGTGTSPNVPPSERAAPATLDPKSPATGTAPRAAASALRREGQFVINQRGRMTPTLAGGIQWLFTFEADAAGLADPPMFLMPCRYLEDMERIVEQQGDNAVFIISGQVFVYRGSNYLLPTLMRHAPDRGNLKP